MLLLADIISGEYVERCITSLFQKVILHSVLLGNECEVTSLHDACC